MAPSFAVGAVASTRALWVASDGLDGQGASSHSGGSSGGVRQGGVAACACTRTPGPELLA